ncbi:WD repeat-containing protein 64 [Cichlidogyrus casuarinus]|uniref:WD repeat-containing protein 64 n=1 Tax=Cichlidogyrus casuarinus TaxID=1844966 RepID=A0ABD2QII1_9PLAT
MENNLKNTQVFNVYEHMVISGVSGEYLVNELSSSFADTHPYRDTIKAIKILPKQHLMTVTANGTIRTWSLKNYSLLTTATVPSLYIGPLRRVLVSSERYFILVEQKTMDKEKPVTRIGPFAELPLAVANLPNEAVSLMLKEDACLRNHFPSMPYFSVIFGTDKGNICLLGVSQLDLNGIGQKKDSNSSNVAVESGDKSKQLKAKDPTVIDLDPRNFMSQILRRKCHSGWITKLEYIADLQSICSTSTDPGSALVIQKLTELWTSRPLVKVPIPKGARVFVYCQNIKKIATGGADRIIRLWHPHILTQPMAKLIGHMFTVVHIAYNHRDRLLISVSSARIFRIWDVQTYTCLQTFTDPDERPGDKTVNAMVFSDTCNRLITGKFTKFFTLGE